MIAISIWKLKRFDCWNCYDIEKFYLDRTDLCSDDNWVSYSWATRDHFKEWFIYKLFSNFEYIQISQVIDRLREIHLDIPDFHTKQNLWDWFMVYTEEALNRFWDDAYIWQDLFLSAEKNMLTEHTKEFNEWRYNQVFENTTTGE